MSLGYYCRGNDSQTCTNNHYIYLGPLLPPVVRTLMTDHEGSATHQTTMNETHFTDAENTGAPLVPMIEPESEMATDGGNSRREDLEEVVWSHRL